MENIPLASYDLISLLDQEFPPACARKGMSIEDIWLEAGRRQLIDMLLRIRSEESENILSTPNVSG